MYMQQTDHEASKLEDQIYSHLFQVHVHSTSMYDNNQVYIIGGVKLKGDVTILVGRGGTIIQRV